MSSDKPAATPEPASDAPKGSEESLRERLRVLSLRGCSQCGQRFEQPACGPTHALIASERAESCPSLIDAERHASKAGAQAARESAALVILATSLSKKDRLYTAEQWAAWARGQAVGRESAT